MRRIVMFTGACLLVFVAAGCRSDGRTLRDPAPYLTSSISTLPAVVEPVDTIDSITSDDPLPTLPPGDNSDALATLTAPWRDGAGIDPRYTCDGRNTSPALSWGPVPEGTVEIALTVADIDAPAFAHWGIAGIAPDVTSLAEGEVPLGAYETVNGAGAIGYTGPCPPAGSAHTYVFTVYFLRAPTTLSDGAGTTELVDELFDREISSTSTKGSFSRG